MVRSGALDRLVYISKVCSQTWFTMFSSYPDLGWAVSLGLARLQDVKQSENVEN